ncbi:unnamed protein product [Caenorhabditis auriculariae]|uniref:Heparan-sulfate 6-O-sulfotransferase n=1 Tax=Caenorhabditis auriculariae TaxID=2777116 RepID=A0A8S1GPL4_9PELO|nr:unnamed protein product [Caenorhabditis auriculariae]
MICSFFYIFIAYDEYEESDSRERVIHQSSHPTDQNLHRRTNEKIERYGFNMSGKDVIVFLHIQKTAGTTFEKFLVRYLNTTEPCTCRAHKKRCTCPRPNSSNETWLFSRYSTGWACGLHADYTELFVNRCVERSLNKVTGKPKNRRYFYTTFLRDPIGRFISEYRHVNRGATWIASRHVCNGRMPTLDELPLCFDPIIGWDGVSIDEFLKCPYNLAFNRQTRMLANLSLIGCYENIALPSEERDRLMLASAKENLKRLSYFGLKERMQDSQWMFEEMFGMQFTKKMSVWSKSKSNDTILSPSQLKAIRHVNLLDSELYEYATTLFEERYQSLRSENLSRKKLLTNLS